MSLEGGEGYSSPPVHREKMKHVLFLFFALVRLLLAQPPCSWPNTVPQGPFQVGVPMDLDNFGNRTLSLSQALWGPGGDVSTYRIRSVAPGEMVSLIGLGMNLSFSGGTVNFVAPQQAQTGGWPSSLGGVSLSVSGKTAPIYYVGPRRDNSNMLAGTEIVFQVPFDVKGDSVDITPMFADPALGICSGQTVTAKLVSAVPALDHNVTTGAVVMQDPSTGKMVDANNPLPGGRSNLLVLYAFGLGPIAPRASYDSNNRIPYPLLDPSTISIVVDGVPAKVLFAGEVPQTMGYYQIALALPAGSQGKAQLLYGGAVVESFTIPVK